MDKHRETKAQSTFECLFRKIENTGNRPYTLAQIKSLLKIPDGHMVADEINELEEEKKAHIIKKYERKFKTTITKMLRKYKRQAATGGLDPMARLREYLSTYKFYNMEALKSYDRKHRSDMTLNNLYGMDSRFKPDSHDSDNHSSDHTDDDDYIAPHRMLNGKLNSEKDHREMPPMNHRYNYYGKDSETVSSLKPSSTQHLSCSMVMVPKNVRELQDMNVDRVPSDRKGADYVGSAINTFPKYGDLVKPNAQDTETMITWLRKVISFIETSFIDKEGRRNYGRTMANTLAVRLGEDRSQFYDTIQEGDGTSSTNKFERPLPHPVQFGEPCQDNDFPAWQYTGRNSGYDKLKVAVALQIVGENKSRWKRKLYDLSLRTKETIRSYNMRFDEIYKDLQMLGPGFVEEEDAVQAYKNNIEELDGPIWNLAGCGSANIGLNALMNGCATYIMQAEVRENEKRRRLPEGVIPERKSDSNKRFKLNTDEPCSHCGKRGHNITDCFMKNPSLRNTRPEGFGGRGNGNNNFNNNDNNNSNRSLNTFKRKEIGGRTSFAGRQNPNFNFNNNNSRPIRNERNEGQPLKEERITHNYKAVATTKGEGNKRTGNASFEASSNNQNRESNSTIPYCNHCSLSGHKEENCWRKFPDQKVTYLSRRNGYDTSNAGKQVNTVASVKILLIQQKGVKRLE